MGQEQRRIRITIKGWTGKQTGKARQGRIRKGLASHTTASDPEDSANRLAAGEEITTAVLNGLGQGLAHIRNLQRLGFTVQADDPPF